MAISCGSISTGYTRSCEAYLAAGIKEIRIANYDPDIVWNADSTGKITGATENSIALTADTFYRIEQRAGVAELTEEFSFNAQYGTKSVTPNITITLLGNNQANRNFANDLLAGNFTVAVELESGEFLLYGYEKGVESSASSANPGVAADDPNIIQITLSGRGREYFPEIDVTFLDSITF